MNQATKGMLLWNKECPTTRDVNHSNKPKWMKYPLKWLEIYLYYFILSKNRLYDKRNEIMVVKT